MTYNLLVAENTYINIPYSDWIEEMINEGNSKALSRDYYRNTYCRFLEVLNVNSKIINNIDSDILSMYNVNNYHIAFSRLTDFEEYMNQVLRLEDIFDVKIGEVFQSDLFTDSNLMISEKNRLLIIGEKQLIKNSKARFRIDPNIRNITFTQLYSIIHQVEYYTAVEVLADTIGITFNDDIIVNRKRERLKREYNVNIIMNSLQDYLNIHRVLKKKIDILTLINQFKESKSTFYLSRSYLAKAIENNGGKIDERNAGRILMGLRVIGLITLNKNPDYLTKRQGSYYSKGKSINYYSITEYTNEVLEEAERRVKILYDNKINIWKLTYLDVENVFGESFAKDIFNTDNDNENDKKKQVNQPAFSISNFFVILFNHSIKCCVR